MIPTYVTSQNAQANSVSQIVLSCTPSLGHCLVIGIYLQDGQAAVSSIFDNMGVDIFDNPLNTYVNLGSINLSGTRVELWGVCPLKAVPNYSIEDLVLTINFTNTQTQITVALLEYSNTSSFGHYGSTSNTGYSDLFFQGTAENNTNIMVTMFGDPSGTGSSGSGTYGVPGVKNAPITPATVRQNVQGWGGQLLALEQTVIFPAVTLVAQIVTPGVAPAGLMAVGVTLNGGFSLQTPPGFSDIDPTQLVTPNILHALKLNQIAQNAALGMVRPEFFYGSYTNGQTVEAPNSPIDGYTYSRDELIYIYTPYTTFDAGTGWTSADGILFYCEWDIDPITGMVIVQEFYHPDGNTPTNQTNDGQLLVLTVGQRGMSGSTISAASGITMDIPPSLFEVDLTKYGEDKPVTQTMMQSLAQNSKFSAIKAEVFYIGEFVNGQQALPPKSYVDGYQYAYDECKFISSWKWTTAPNNYGPPPMYTASGGNADGGWSQLNYMQASVDAGGNVTCDVHFYNHGDIDPSQPANGGVPYGRLRVYCFCQRNKGPYFGIPELTTDSGNQVAASSQVVKIPGSLIYGSVTGNLSVQLEAAVLNALNVSKVVIKRTLAGSNTVIDTTDFGYSAIIGAGTSATAGPLSNWTFDSAHDYYIIVIFTGYFRYGTILGNINKTSPQNAVVQAVDESGASDTSFFSSDGVYWRMVPAIRLTIVGDTTANEFSELPLTDQVAVFVPGNELPFNYMQQLAENVKESAYAIEFFGPTNHVNGDTISLPTSPTDGYEYSRDELVYIWQWHDTGNPEIRLFGWGASISNTGLVNMMCWHVPSGHTPKNDTAGASIDVITIACRQQTTAAQLTPLSTNNGNPPSDNSSGTFGGSGGYTINGGS